MELWGVDWALAANFSQVLATIGLVITLVFTGIDLRRSARDSDRNYRAAEASAERAEAAARVSIDQFSRMAEALEVLVTKVGTASVGDQEPARVRWSLTHFKGDTYKLENEGNASAFAIALEGHRSLRGPQDIVGGPDLEPGEALTFMAARSMATSDAIVTVHWRSEDGVKQTWRYPLPPRPAR